MRLCYFVLRQMQNLWGKDQFLRNGGHLKFSRRKVEGFHYAFAALHAK